MMQARAWAAGVVLLAALGAAPAPGEAPPRTVQERLGHPASARLLILHADDFGMAHSVNRATAEALSKGWITSASILVPCPWFPEVARFARAHPEADLGIHLALNSEWTTFRWAPLSPRDAVPSLLDADGYFPLLETVPAAKAHIPEVLKELRSQVEKARAAGIPVSHLDSHMGALFQTAPLFGAYLSLGREYGLPILMDRSARPPAGSGITGDDILVDRVLGIEPGVPLAGWREAYEKILAPLPPGVYQLIVHLAEDDAEMRGATADHPDWGAAWRQADYDLVRNPEFQAFLKREGFVLTDWKTLARASAAR